MSDCSVSPNYGFYFFFLLKPPRSGLLPVHSLRSFLRGGRCSFLSHAGRRLRLGAVWIMPALFPLPFHSVPNPPFFHPFPQEQQQTLNCNHLLHTSSSGLASPKRRRCSAFLQGIAPQNAQPQSPRMAVKPLHA